MSKTSVTSQKFSALEVVDSLKLDDELVFSDLAMSGTDLLITASNGLAISSTGTGVGSGVTVTSVSPMTLSTPVSQINLLGGFEEVGVGGGDGSIVIGYDADGTPTAVVEVNYDSATDSARLALFGAKPVVQPNDTIVGIVKVPGVSTTPVNEDDTFAGYTIGQVVVALQAVGILA